MDDQTFVKCSFSPKKTNHIDKNIIIWLKSSNLTKEKILSVKSFHITLSALFLLVQTHDIKASDNFLEEEQKQSKSTSTKESFTSTKTGELASTMATSTKTKRTRPTTLSVTPSSSSSQPAQSTDDLLDSLIGKSISPKIDNFVIPQTLDIYDTLLVLFAGQEQSRNNKIYFVDRGFAASFGSLETGTTIELEAFLHASKIKGHAGFDYLKKMFLVENPKTEGVTTKAEKTFKGDRTKLKDIEKARENIKTARTNLGYLLVDSVPGNNKDKNLLSITAEYDLSEKRPQSTIAGHNSHQAKYYLYVDDVQTKFSFWLNLYRMKVK